MAGYLEKQAIISDCGTYRYWLFRRMADGPTALFIMLNPSTADANHDDPTIRRCRSFAEREGCGAFAVVNLFSLRAFDPRALATHPAPHGPAEVEHTRHAITAADGPVICAWGADPAARCIQPYMVDFIRAAGKTPMCLGKTAGGMPRHPLYVKGDKPLEVF